MKVLIRMATYLKPNQPTTNRPTDRPTNQPTNKPNKQANNKNQTKIAAATTKQISTKQNKKHTLTYFN